MVATREGPLRAGRLAGAVGCGEERRSKKEKKQGEGRGKTGGGNEKKVLVVETKKNTHVLLSLLIEMEVTNGQDQAVSASACRWLVVCLLFFKYFF